MNSYFVVCSNTAVYGTLTSLGHLNRIATYLADSHKDHSPHPVVGNIFVVKSSSVFRTDQFELFDLENFEQVI